MPRTRIKICGITSPQDALLAAELGADYIGLNFLAGPRKVSGPRGTRIVASLPRNVQAIGLISADDLDRWYSVPPADRLGLPELAHFQVYRRAGQPIRHGGVWLVEHVTSRETIGEIALRLYNVAENVAFGTTPDGDVICRESLTPAALVLDNAVKGALGGTGQTFNWNWIAGARAAGELAGWPPIILAGGLTPDNVADAIRIARPYAVDVSSGVELPGKPGVKDPARMRDFIQAVRSTDA